MDTSAASLHTFLTTHHRLPRLGENPAPFSFHGWLLPYVVLAHRVIPETGNRWAYHLALHQAQSLPPDPIPFITFESTAYPPTMKAVSQWIDIAEQRGRSSDGFGLLIDWLAYGLGVSKEPSRLSIDVQTQLYRDVGVHHLLQHPYDYLGELLSASKAKGWNKNAFFPTPHNIVEMMVRMTMGSAPHEQHDDLRTKTCCDPCCGTGRMLLHSSNMSLRLYGLDIDSLVCKIAAINGALYAPWLSFPLPEHLFAELSHPLPSESILNPPTRFAIHTHHTYQAMTQTHFVFDPDEPVPV